VPKQHDPLRRIPLRAKLIIKGYTLISFVFFFTVWSLDVYLNSYGHRSPLPAAGAIYPVMVKMGRVYVTKWQYPLAGKGAELLSVTLMFVTLFLRCEFVPFESILLAQSDS
jgi:hypothetical protein